MKTAEATTAKESIFDESGVDASIAELDFRRFHLGALPFIGESEREKASEREGPPLGGKREREIGWVEKGDARRNGATIWR